MPYQHLALEERHYIETQWKLGVSQNRIARALGRSQSSVSWELSRNRGVPGLPLQASQQQGSGAPRRQTQGRQDDHDDEVWRREPAEGGLEPGAERRTPETTRPENHLP